jgi:hypothetical protein
MEFVCLCPAASNPPFQPFLSFFPYAFDRCATPGKSRQNLVAPLGLEHIIVWLNEAQARFSLALGERSL